MLNLLRRLHVAHGDRVQEATLVRINRFLDQVAVHQHQGLRNCAVEGRGFLAFVVAKSDHELLHPFTFQLFLLFVAAPRFVGLRGHEQRLI